MTAVADVSASPMQKRCARCLEDWDDHAIIGVEYALAAGVTLEELGVSRQRLQEARVRFVKYALTTLLLEGSARHFNARAKLYIALQAVDPAEVSVKLEHQLLLENYGNEALDPDPDSEITNERSRLEKAIANS